MGDYTRVENPLSLLDPYLRARASPLAATQNLLDFPASAHLPLRADILPLSLDTVQTYSPPTEQTDRLDVRTRLIAPQARAQIMTPFYCQRDTVFTLA